MPEIKRLQRIIDILSETLNTMNKEIGTHIRQQYKDKHKSVIQRRNGSYPFIPYSSGVAVEKLLMAFEHFGNTWYEREFLDAGCGIGNIMLLAYKAGFMVHGLEIDLPTINMAKKINKSISCKIERQNIMTYKNYSKYDIVYYFCPFESLQEERKFEEYVENQMKVGAVLIPNNKQSRKIVKDKRFRPITKRHFSPIYVKKSK